MRHQLLLMLPLPFPERSEAAECWWRAKNRKEWREIHQVIEDEQYKNEIVKEQKKRLQDFSYENIKEQILDELKKVQRSKIDKVRKQNGEEKAD